MYPKGKTAFFILLVKNEKSKKDSGMRKSLFWFCRIVLSFSCLEEELVEEVTRITGKNERRYFGKERKILGTVLSYRCTLCSFRVFLNLRLVLQVSVEEVFKSPS